jgi:heat-inducible transcriptional repressor
VTRAPQDPSSLDERSRDVLVALVRHHIHSGQPVGSSAVSRDLRTELSPASVRAIMAELEERGFLVQPHTSAGRVPTDRAFRFYVDHLAGRPKLAPTAARLIEHALAGAGGIDAVLEEASRQLSRLSHHVGIVLGPDLRRLIVERLDFIRLDDRRVVALLLDRTGRVHDRVLTLPDAPHATELERAGRYLSDELAGRTLPEMRRLVESRLAEDRAVYDRLMVQALELGRRALAEVDDEEARLFVEGASNLLGLPDFPDLDLLRDMLRALEDKRRLADLLTRILEEGGPRVVIGQENPVTALARGALVVATYGTESGAIGMVGLVGPVRMAYPRSLGLVTHLADLLSQRLAASGN